jgi:LysR family transcriptional activator of mexEF-oprN operon
MELISMADLTELDLNLLKVFEALHEERSASRAALRLGLTQSAVSAALARLRQVYGDPLFRRTGRGLAPTLLAEQLHPVLAEALARCRHSLAMAAPGPDGSGFAGRSVILGLSDDFELAFGRPLVERLALAAPGLRLIFRQTHSQIVGADLAERRLDLALVAGGLSGPSLSRQLLGDGGYACVVDPARFDMAAPLDVARFAASEHLLISSGGLIGIVDEALAARGLARRVAAATTHFAALPFLLTGSAALATLPAHAARAIAAITPLRVIACPLALRRYPIELGWRTAALADPAVARVRQAVEECVGVAAAR